MIELKNIRQIDLQTITDSRGSVSVLESGKNTPFEVKRTFHIYNVEENAERGSHAHKKNEQVYACLNGSVTITFDDGINKEDFVLSDPSKGLYVGPMMWHTLKNFSPGTVLFVWNSMGYDEDDYIKDYDEFLKIANENRL